MVNQESASKLLVVDFCQAWRKLSFVDSLISFRDSTSASICIIKPVPSTPRILHLGRILQSRRLTFVRHLFRIGASLAHGPHTPQQISFTQVEGVLSSQWQSLHHPCLTPAFTWGTFLGAVRLDPHRAHGVERASPLGLADIVPALPSSLSFLCLLRVDSGAGAGKAGRKDLRGDLLAWHSIADWTV